MGKNNKEHKDDSVSDSIQEKTQLNSNLVGQVNLLQEKTNGTWQVNVLLHSKVITTQL